MADGSWVDALLEVAQWASAAPCTEPETAEARARIHAQFQGYKVDSVQPSLRFNGASATIVCSRDYRVSEGDVNIGLRIERYARNEAGEYFMFISDGTGKPFFKHVTQKMARLVLEEKYIEPDC